MDQLRQLELEIKELTAEVRGLRNDVKVASEADTRSREALHLAQSNKERIDRLESSRLSMLFGLLLAGGYTEHNQTGTADGKCFPCHARAHASPPGQ